MNIAPLGDPACNVGVASPPREQPPKAVPDEAAQTISSTAETMDGAVPAPGMLEENPAQNGAGAEDQTDRQSQRGGCSCGKCPSCLAAGASAQLNQQEQAQLSQLKSRDREVRAHEQAHRAAGGRYAGGASYTYETGPDGKQYAVGGEVPIDTSKVPDDPQATMQKASQIRRAALAPAKPSSQDRQVAAQASQMEAEARRELAQQQSQAASAALADQMAPVAGGVTQQALAQNPAAAAGPPPISARLKSTHVIA